MDKQHAKMLGEAEQIIDSPSMSNQEKLAAMREFNLKLIRMPFPTLKAGIG